MDSKNRTSVDCACLIHGSGYDWIYVDHLYNMLNRTLQNRVRLHVYTEADRPVPSHMIKHELKEWPGISGPRRSWWYKLQLFDSEHHSGDLLYFDLDTVIVRDITWIPKLTTEKLWTIRDFRNLQNPNHWGMNSSVMWWNVSKFDWVWEQFKNSNIATVISKHPHGDQQYIGNAVGHNAIRFLDANRVQSWRWQAYDGGFDFVRRQAKTPGTGTHINNDVAILVFHGQPKPHELLNDVVIKQHWK